MLTSSMYQDCATERRVKASVFLDFRSLTYHPWSIRRSIVDRQAFSMRVGRRRIADVIASSVEHEPVVITA